MRDPVWERKYRQLREKRHKAFMAKWRAISAHPGVPEIHWELPDPDVSGSPNVREEGSQVSDEHHEEQTYVLGSSLITEPKGTPHHNPEDSE